MNKCYQGKVCLFTCNSCRRRKFKAIFYISAAQALTDKCYLSHLKIVRPDHILSRLGVGWGRGGLLGGGHHGGPAPRHTPDSAWARYLPMFDVLISYFPGSSIPMFRARVISYNEAGTKLGPGHHNDSISPLDQNYDVKFRNEIRKISPESRYCGLYLF